MSSTVRKWIKELECPVCLDLMEEAVGLIPCGHAICNGCFLRIQTVARKMMTHWCGCLPFVKTLQVKPCPVCRLDTNDKIPLWIIQNLASISQSFAIDVEEDHKENVLPYPGIAGAKLVLERSWSEVFHAGGYAQKYGFRSVHPNSLVQKVEVFGLWDGKVALAVKFKDLSDPELVKYMEGHGISMKLLQEDWILDPIVIQTLFSLIDQNNFFPKDHVHTVRRIIQNPQNWRAILYPT